MPNDLPTATLGRTGIEVTRLGFGGMALRDESIKWPIEDAHAEAVLNAVLDSGIDYIDTADCYGRSEPFIGRFLSHRRDEYRLATKCGCIPNGRDWTRENLFKGLERSLKRLQTDHIDVMQLHGAKPEDVDDGGLVDALEEMRKQGKVRWIGASTGSPSLETFTERGDFDVFQIPYSGISRGHEEAITAAAAAGMGTVIRGGVAQGEPGVGTRGQAANWSKWDEAGLDDLRDEGEARTSFLLRLTLTHPDIHTVIVGSQSTDHIRQNAEAARRGPLSAEVYEEAKRRLAGAGEEPE